MGAVIRRFWSYVSVALKLAAVALGVGCLLAWGGWIASGGSLFVVTTPSMSPVEPVGSLLVVRPATGPIRVGSIMVFEPPTNGPEFAHKIVASLPGGRYESRGLLNSSRDPWVLTRANMRGRVVTIIPALGRIMQAIPIWAVCALLYLLGGMALPRYRFEMSVLSLTAGLIIPLILFRPLVSAVVITAVMLHHELNAYLVSTGILNSWVGSGRAVFMAAGHTSVLHIGGASGMVVIPLRAALLWWQWAVLGLICGSPLWLSIAYVRHSHAADVAAVTS